MSFGSRLREARVRSRMTQSDLARAVSVTTSAIGNYETGVSTPKEVIRIELMKVLGVDANFLYQDYGIPKSVDICCSGNPTKKSLSSTPTSNIAENIRRYRKEARMTQKEFALKIGKSYSSVQKYELDLAQPYIDLIRKMAEILGVDYWEIIGFNSVTSPEPTADVTIIDYKEAQEHLRIILTEPEYKMLRTYQAADDRARQDALSLLEQHPRRK